MHRWFEEVEWSDAFDLADEDLLAIGRRLVLRRGLSLEPDALDQALVAFRAALQQPEIAAALARRADAREAPWREREFALLLPDEAGGEVLVRGSFDRVVLHAGGAEILDFKTDQVGDADRLAERVEHYRPQMEQYRRVLSELESLAPENIVTRLLFVTAGRVETV